MKDWLVKADPVWLGPAVVRAEGVNKELILAAVAFNFGLSPGAPLWETLGW